jgi:hypothetical protein
MQGCLVLLLMMRKQGLDKNRHLNNFTFLYVAP